LKKIMQLKGPSLLAFLPLAFNYYIKYVWDFIHDLLYFFIPIFVFIGLATFLFLTMKWQHGFLWAYSVAFYEVAIWHRTLFFSFDLYLRIQLEFIFALHDMYEFACETKTAV
jgi:hypothetical protein